jgi:ABC-type transport system involved in cytochrome bd biosynthesis fused ATPase/permease subunit
MTKLRVTLYRSFSNLNLIQIGKYSRSQALQRLTKGVETSQDFWLRLVIPWASAMIAGISGIGILNWLVPQYSIICAVAYLGLAFVLPFLGFISSASALEESKGISEEEITELIAHSCDSIEEALIFQYSNQLEADVTQSSRKLLERSNTEAKFTGSSTALVTIVTGAMTAIAIIYAIAAFKDGSIGGINIAVISLLPMVIFDTLAPLPVAFSNYKDIKSSVLTLEEVSKLSGLNEFHEKELVTFFNNRYPKDTVTNKLPIAQPVLTYVAKDLVELDGAKQIIIFKDSVIALTEARVTGKDSVITLFVKKESTYKNIMFNQDTQIKDWKNQYNNLYLANQKLKMKNKFTKIGAGIVVGGLVYLMIAK